MKKIRVAAPLAVLGCVFSVAGSAWSQTFPSKPIRLVVAYPPGGATDILARAITPRAGELLANTRMLFIPYKGGAQATTDMLAGQVPLVLQPVVTFLPHVKSGKARILAVMLPKRWEEMPDVPTIQEAVPGFEKAPGGTGIWGPAGIAPAVAQRLQAALAAGLRQPEIAGRLKSQGMIPIGNTPAEFAKSIDEGVVINQRLVKAAGVEIR